METNHNKLSKVINHSNNLCKKNRCYNTKKIGSNYCELHFINFQYIELAEKSDVTFGNFVNTKKIDNAKLNSKVILSNYYNQKVKDILDNRKLSSSEIKNRKAYSKFLMNSNSNNEYFCNYPTLYRGKMCDKLITHKDSTFCSIHFKKYLLEKLKKEQLPKYIEDEINKAKNFIVDVNFTCRYFCNSKQVICGKICKKYYSLRFCTNHLNTEQSLNVMLKRIQVLTSKAFCKDVAEIIASYI